MALGTWALRQLTTTDFSAIHDLEDLELQIRSLSRLAGLSYDEATMSVRRAWTASVAGSRSHGSPGEASADRVASLGAARPAPGRLPAEAGGTVEFLAAAVADEGSPDDGFQTPRNSYGRRLDPFSTPSPQGPSLLGALPKEGPKGLWKGIAAAKGPEANSPPVRAPAAAAAEPGASPGGASPPREVIDREMLEMIKDMRDLIKAPPSPPKDGRAAPVLGNDEIA